MSRENKTLTKEKIVACIKGLEYKTIEICDVKMMFCGIKMINEFVVVGKPAVCIDPASWSDEKGKEVSYENTFEKLWELEAYRVMSE